MVLNSASFFCSGRYLFSFFNVPKKTEVPILLVVYNIIKTYIILSLPRLTHINWGENILNNFEGASKTGGNQRVNLESGDCSGWGVLSAPFPRGALPFHAMKDSWNSSRELNFYQPAKPEVRIRLPEWKVMGQIMKSGSHFRGTPKSVYKLHPKLWLITEPHVLCGEMQGAQQKQQLEALV